MRDTTDPIVGDAFDTPGATGDVTGTDLAEEQIRENEQADAEAAEDLLDGAVRTDPPGTDYSQDDRAGW